MVSGSGSSTRGDWGTQSNLCGKVTCSQDEIYQCFDIFLGGSSKEDDDDEEEESEETEDRKDTSSRSMIVIPLEGREKRT